MNQIDITLKIIVEKTENQIQTLDMILLHCLEKKNHYGK